jgi:hypothetical protein
MMMDYRRILRPGDENPDVWWETIGPAKARRILEKNQGNRNVAKQTLNRYARDMEEDRWRRTGDPIRVTEDGRILDGQHRLMAVVKSGVTLPFLICRLPDASAMDAIDTGKRRTFSDYLKIKEIAAAGAVANVVRTHHQLMSYLARDGADTATPIPVLWRLYQDTPEEIWRAAIQAGNPPEARRLKMRSTLPACYVAFCKNGDGEAAAEFADKIRTGADLRVGDPVHTLRRAMGVVAADKTKSLELRSKLFMIVRAWNGWVRGEDLRVIKMRGLAFPKILKAEE